MWITQPSPRYLSYPSKPSGAGGTVSTLCPARENTMTTKEDMPHPDNCKWCREARSCPTFSFESNVLMNPLPNSGQTMGDYYNKLCECGHQTLPSFEFKGEDTPKRLQHTTLCKEHTMRWMQKVIDLKMKFNPETYREPIT